MSNFQCPHCGMTNVDCGEAGYKTPKEIEYEKSLAEIYHILYKSQEGVRTKIANIYEVIDSFEAKNAR